MEYSCAAIFTSTANRVLRCRTSASKLESPARISGPFAWKLGVFRKVNAEPEGVDRQSAPVAESNRGPCMARIVYRDLRPGRCLPKKTKIAIIEQLGGWMKLFNGVPNRLLEEQKPGEYAVSQCDSFERMKETNYFDSKRGKTNVTLL